LGETLLKHFVKKVHKTNKILITVKHAKNTLIFKKKYIFENKFEKYVDLSNLQSLFNNDGGVLYSLHEVNGKISINIDFSRMIRVLIHC